MIEVEFEALIEATAPVHVWTPTAEQLHRMFWVEPLTYSFTVQSEAAAQGRGDAAAARPTPLEKAPGDIGLPVCAAEQTAGTSDPSQPRSDWFDKVERQAWRDRSLALANQRRLTGRYVVQVFSGGQWFDIDESRTDSKTDALAWAKKHQRVQPHLILRVCANPDALDSLLGT